MKMTKYLKYVVVAGIAGALALAPVSQAIAAASALETAPAATVEYKSAADIAEAARQADVTAAFEKQAEESRAAANRTVDGTKSAVNGFYIAKSVNGVALAPKAADADSNLYVKVTDTDKKKSAAAMEVANAVAGSLNATVGPCINVTYGKMEGGKFVSSTDGSAGALSIGIPANFRADGAKYAVLGVYEGGVSAVYYPKTASDKSVTVNVNQASSADVMYALLRY